MQFLGEVFNHLVMPPRLPGRQDEDIEEIEREVLMRTIRASNSVQTRAGSPWSEAFHSLIWSLRACRTLNRGQLEKSTMLAYFRQLQPNRVLILHVVQQNAALLIRRETCDDQDHVIFEAFETSATSEHVLAARQALQWDFPGRSVQLSLADFSDEQFQESLAGFLEQASMEALYSLQAQARKANVVVTESRDTTDPALITDMLMPLLEAMGKPFQSPVIRKHVRDEAVIQKADLPWRRLPFWLVLRVATQRQLSLVLGSEHGRIGYKFLLSVVLAQLLKDSAERLSPDLTITLRAKICRRMAKLEMDRTAAASVDAEIYECLFNLISPMVKEAIDEATSKVNATWEGFKRTTTRRVPKLPSRAPDSALCLSLPNSGEHLEDILSSHSSNPWETTSLDLPQPLDKAIKQTQDFTDRIFRLAAIETMVDREEQPNLDDVKTDQDRCLHLARYIDKVFDEVGTAYDSDPEQMSALILALFTLWVRLDRCAVEACPLLREYAPAFGPELLDVLQLPTLSSMRRLQDTQTYLARRRSGCRFGTILGSINDDCFAVQYVTQCPKMQALGSRIQGASDQAQSSKEAEWKERCDEYDDYTEKMQQGICCCTWDQGRRDVRGCKKCWQGRARKRLKISIHEAFLPKANPARSAVLFELAIPGYLAAYRDVTWRILSILAHPDRPAKSSSPAIHLMGCLPLQRYMTKEVPTISLASTIKCFEQTHYKFNDGKVPLSRVVLPFAAQFRLYDKTSGLWVNDLDQPLTFQHLCGVHIPRALQVTILPPMRHPLPYIEGPSSYEVQANQNQCPFDMSVHEFSAYQKLLAGQTRRWPNIMVEMGSSNLNFSNEDTTRMLSQLAVQAGPQLRGEVFRTAHVVFREPGFLERLAETIESRLNAIGTNWREHHCLELLITLTLRLFQLSSGAVRVRAEKLLKTARDTSLQWIAPLRKEVEKAVTAHDGQRAGMYGLYAALLCRRTFSTYVELNRAMTKDDLATWVQAGVAFQQNLLEDMDKLPKTLKGILIRDAKLAYHIESLLRNAIQTYPSGVGDGIARSWSDSLDCTAVFSSWQFLPRPHGQWIVAATSRTQQSLGFSQTVHLHIVEGHLLVNGRPRGKLPLEIRDNPAVKEMFGSQHLSTFPSTLPGMTHQLETYIEKQEVHFGLRGEQVVIRSLTKDALLEFIPRHIFTGTDIFDLPTELVDNCVHWLNLTTKCLEIRRSPNVWHKKPRDWIIDVTSRRAHRGVDYGSQLVDPQSDVFAQIAGIFRHFEEPQRLTVYQPQSSHGELHVDLRHLDLSFHVNPSGWLHCRQLNAKIGPNQDAGTWYGLQSAIVLRATKTHKRSIIVPLGGLVFNRRGMHVEVRIRNARDYGRYDIDDVLGRLLCPPEPRLLYTKALCHAATSFCLPDRLTGRTGTEEAFLILRSGAAQPWTPLGDDSYSILRQLHTLLPRREYYPAELRRLQMVTWDRDLTTTIQHDGYESLIRQIVERSNHLKEFASPPCKKYPDVPPESHLRRRGETQRQLYDRPTLDVVKQSTRYDIYSPRGRDMTRRAGNVYQIARMIRSRCSSLHIGTRLRSVLETWQTIGGFHDNGDTLPVGDPLISQIEDPIPDQWGDLVNFCRHAQSQAPLLFRLGLLAFAPNVDLDVIRLLAAFACIDELRSLEPPAYSSFENFRSRGIPPVELLRELIIPARHDPLKPGSSSEIRALHRDDALAYQAKCEEESVSLATHLQQQWPTPAGTLSAGHLETPTIDVPLALEKIEKEWERRRQNQELQGYVHQVQTVLDLRMGPRDTSTLFVWKDQEPVLSGAKYAHVIPSAARDLVVKAGPDLEDPVVAFTRGAKDAALGDRSPKRAAKEPASEVAELEGILHQFARRSADALRQQYGSDLLQSLSSLKDAGRMFVVESDVPVPTYAAVDHAVQQARATMSHYHQQIRIALAANDRRSNWLKLGSVWPCMTPTAMLELLRSRSLDTRMKESLVAFGLAVTGLQRLERIHCALLLNDQRALSEELRNPGHENWSPFEIPEWLLLEIDGNVLVRPQQVDVARAVIAPASRNNSVLQMNMGQGKTSFIVPMVVALLADGKNLTRLIVPKALLMQTAQTAQSRLGGLVGRQVCHVPFSRKTPTTPEALKLYAQLHHEIRDTKGLIITSHEHLLSYKLGGWQHLADGKLKAASTMIKFQNWLNDNCRDILDECDYTLSVKTQLNYPGGPEMAVDGHPFRWQAAQGLLDTAASHFRHLRHQYPSSIEVLERQGSFPTAQFLKTDAEDALHSRILDDICAGRAEFLRPANPNLSSVRQILRRVLSDETFDPDLFAQAAGAFANPQAASKTLLVVRGLLVSRILLLCLGKRWNVQYGLHPNRHPIAVPFESKGTPSEQSEFGHPDVSILLTCLAFYYTGLTSKQFSQGLQHVLQSEDPAAQYEWWTSDCHSLPETLRHWNAINTDDGGQVEELWKHLHRNRTVINHYMNNFVFPAHARQFEVKLQASAWDIPLFAKDTLPGAKTTGFSGTNDNRTMLPLTIRQDDLASLRQTGAEVLSYLLQPRNRNYQVTTTDRGKRLEEKELLERLYRQHIRILIDAGAYILEMDNMALAQKWLETDPQAKAAVYFRSDNRAWVHFRDKTKEDVPLLATPFSDDLSECLVYLDEAHTRGVDLKLPVKACGALTLALKQTKDYTVQAAMRLRQLSTTQSVTFFAPPEVDQSIRDFCRILRPTRLDSSHVVSWLLEQTCRTNEDLQSLYVAQGIDFCQRTDAAWRHTDPVANATHRGTVLKALRRSERQTLDQLYGRAPAGTDTAGPISDGKLRAFVDQLIQSGSGGLGAARHKMTGALEEVEQEREVQVQVEQVRQVQRPPRYEALAFPGLHPTISRFAHTGVLGFKGTDLGGGEYGYEHAFACVAKTKLGRRFGVRKTSSRLFVSAEFGKSVKVTKYDDLAGSFLRPVEWILWAPSTQTALVVIPEEAELLIPMLRKAADRSDVHLMAYAAPVTKAMLPFNRFQCYNLPPLPDGHEFPSWFRTELGLFAGCLYVDSAEGASLADYLRPQVGATESTHGADDAAFRPVVPGAGAVRFAADPAAFVLEWLSVRRKVQDILHTPMGYICMGKTLDENKHPSGKE